MFYIEPDLKSYKTINELIDSKEPFFFFKPNITINDLMLRPRLFIVSEPGYGKTRLLKEQLLKNDRSGIFLDLKKIKNNDIEQYIDETEIQNIKDNKHIDDLDKKKYFMTKNFKLNTKNQLLFCFDALDEVKNEDFSNIIENIKKIINKYKKSNFLISCRKNYLKKWKNLFFDIDFDYVEIFPLSKSKTKNFLASFEIKEKEINTLLDKLHFQDRQLIIQTPRYLEMIAKLVRNEGVDSINNISRSGLFEKFIYQKLNTESEKIGEMNNREIIKKVLEKLALIMEIYQTNQISKEELMEFFDDTKSNLNISFLNQVPISSFYDRSLLRDNIDTIEFENTEFQEYLAAKEISRLGRVEQVVFDLTVEPQLGEINPSWINTLSFVIESDIFLLKKILKYIFSNKNITNIEDYVRLLTKYNIEKLSTKDRQCIFKMIYLYYQNEAQWITKDIAEKLSFYYDNSLQKIVEKFYLEIENKDDRATIKNANSITFIAYLFDKKILPEEYKVIWQKRIIDIIKNKAENEDLLSCAIFAAGKYKNINLFSQKLVNELINTKKDIIITGLLNALENSSIDSPILIKCILQGIKLNNISARYVLARIKNKKSLKIILNSLSANEKNILRIFIEHESIYQEINNNLIENIKKVIDPEIIIVLKNLVYTAFSDDMYYWSEKSHFIEDIISIINANDKNFIFELIDKCSDFKSLYEFQKAFAILLTKEDIGKFIKLIKRIDKKQTRIALWVLQQIKYSKRSDNVEIFESGRSFLKDEYKQQELLENKCVDEQKKADLKIYDDFKFNLEPEKGKYYPYVFQFYLENIEKLKDYTTTDDIMRLEKLIKESIFSKFDPAKQKLTIKKQKNGSTRFITHSWINYFGVCILIASKLKIDISLYRQQILYYIPFAFDDHQRAIFDLIPNPTSQELENVLKIFENRNDDLENFMPSSTINFCYKFEIEKGIPLLKKFVGSKKLTIYEKISALDAIANIGKNENKYFKSKFLKYKDKKNELAEKANEILINKYKEKSAIDWRFEQIKIRAFPFERPKGVHRINKEENELDDKQFARPLIQLIDKDLIYKNQYFILLKESLVIINKKAELFAYASYMWSIVIEHYENLKELRDYKILDDLEKFAIENNKQKGINIFRYKLQKLKYEYITYIGKPINISACIKKYNFFKDNQYLDIATPRELFELLQDIINTKINIWWNSEGGSAIVKKYGKTEGAKKRQDEDFIQKIIKPYFENALLRVLKTEGLIIHRESQLLTDERTDFLVSHGFIGTVLIEIKLSSNPQSKATRVEGKKYKSKLKSYISGSNADYGIFVVFDVSDENKKKNYLPELEKLYSTDKNIKIIVI